MEYIILAAGIGKRLQALGANTPKCLLELHGVPLVERIIDTIDPENTHTKTIVIGEEGECWNEKNRSRFDAYPARIISNPKNVTLDNTYSLYLALQEVKSWPVVIIDGDLVFQAKIFQQLIDVPHDNVLLSRPMHSTDKGGVIRVDTDNHIVEIGESVEGEGPFYIYAGIAKIGEELGRYLIGHLQEHVKIVDALHAASATLPIYNETFSDEQAWININTEEKFNEARELYGKK